MIQDCRYAIRNLLGSRGLLTAVVLTLALGVGASTSVFSVVDGVLLKPFPVQDQDRLVVIWKTARTYDQWPLSYESYVGLRERLNTVSGLAAHLWAGAFPGVLRLPDGSGATISRSVVTGNWFEVLGVRARAGRLLTEADDQKGAEPVAVISSGAAERLFGTAPNAVGRTLTISEITYAVVGVTPKDFDYPRRAEVWLPSVHYRASEKIPWHLIARIRPGLTVEQMRSDLSRAAAALPSDTDDEAIRATSFADVIVGDLRTSLFVLGAAVLLMWIAASVNVANLLLVRNLGRQRDFGVRTALGATRGRLIREAAIEGFLLASMGTALGALVAYIVLPALLALAPPELPRLSSIAIDVRALVFAIALGGVAVLVGMIPTAQSGGLEPIRSLRMGNSRGATEGKTRGLRNALVVAQVAIATLVLATGGLLLRSFDRMQRIDLGFTAEQLVLAEVSLPFGKAAEHQPAMRQLAERVASLPGITAATAIGAQPFAGTQGADGVLFGEGQVLDPRATPMVNYEGVDAAYFSTMQLSIRRGRAITAADRAGSAPVVVINEALARLFWPDQEAVGRRVRWEWEKTFAVTVVGVAADMRYRELTTARPTVYVPYEQGIPVMPRFIAIRTTQTAGLTSLVRQAVADTSPRGLLLNVVPLDGFLQAPLARPRFQSALVLSFAIFGTVLAIVGAYGAITFTVRQRTREIAIRMALGASAPHVRWLVLRQGFVLGSAGILLGLLGAVAAGRIVQPMLFEVGRIDVPAFGAAAATLALATLAAALLPVRRATRVDPMIVMRSE